MIAAKLTRLPSSDHGTFGHFILGDMQWETCERPWLGDQADISCIPTGIYVCKYTLSPRLGKYTYEVLDVPNRSGIRIHSANFASQLEGCIALGKTKEIVDGVPGVFQSRDAIKEFETLANQLDFTLEIK